MNKRGVVFSLGTFLILFITLTFALALLRFDQVMDDELSDAAVRDTILYHAKDIGYDMIGLTGADLYIHGTQGAAINFTGRIVMGQTNFSNAIYNYTTYYQSYITPNMNIDWTSPLYHLTLEGYDVSMDINQTRLFSNVDEQRQLTHLILRVETLESLNSEFWTDEGVSSGYPLIDVHVTNETGTATYSGYLDPEEANILTFDVGTIEFGDTGAPGDGNLDINWEAMNITELYIQMDPIEELAYLRTTDYVNLTLAGQNMYAPISIAELGR